MKNFWVSFLFGTSLLVLVIGWVVLNKESAGDGDYNLILHSAINGDPISMYRIGERQKDYKEQYAWFILCKEYIVATPKPHSVKMNRTEFEIDAAIKFFDENFSPEEKGEAQNRVRQIRSSILRSKKN